MYRVIEIRQDELPKYKGKILQVISREMKEFTDYWDWSESDGLHPVISPKWVLTCLVEEEEEK